MITEDKITDFFCIADDFCKVFDAQMAKFSFKAERKRKFLGGTAAYCYFPKKPTIKGSEGQVHWSAEGQRNLSVCRPVAR